MQHKPQLDAARQADSVTYDFSPSFRYIAPYFRRADLAIVNLETTLSYRGPYTGYPAFCSPASLADAMYDMGVDVAALANNHCCDRSLRGIRSTTAILDSMKISRVGVYPDSLDYQSRNILYLKRCDIRFAIVNYTYGTNGIPVPRSTVVNLLDTVAIARDLKQIDRSEVDCVIAVVHWGNEYELKSNSIQRRQADFLRRNGVDVIFGSHPHVVQPAEIYPDGVVVYSLGNFVSNQRTVPRDGGLVATLDIEITDSLDSSGRTTRRTFDYDLTLTPVWVHLPDYAILPPEVGDTLTMSADSRMRYRRFMADTRRRLNL
ncbi:MAG: CapA family protein [Alistipes sp.]|nr:CapA family protein [Alistipes sp.]